MITDEKLFDVAVAYYIKGKLQREIAEELGVSRVQVSKYLSLAHKRGVVGISVNPPWVEDNEEERYQILFKQFFDIDSLILTPKLHHENKTYQVLIEHATNYLINDAGQIPLNVGVGWGKTIYDISLQKNPNNESIPWTISPLAVTSNFDDDYFNYHAITSNFKSLWGTETSDPLMSMLATNSSYEQHLNTVTSLWESLDMLVFGIGISFTRYPGSRTHLFPKDTLNKLRTLDITGDIINTFFDIDGNLFIPKSSEMVTVPFNILKNVKKKVAIASGCQKVPSIIGACRSGLVDTLVTDIQTAKLIMEYLD
ncbi:MAG: hypothetical protein GX938_09135 [Spirochaetales bacterium]|nr:hypothetical protein [Spirochaetales bacterium]